MNDQERLEALRTEINTREWLENECKRRGYVDWDALTITDQRNLLRSVPCTIRCWRVGVAIPKREGCTCCDECGAPYAEMNDDAL